MAETVFDIFGDHLARHRVKTVARQPLSNNENIGKAVLSGPVKPNEPMKKKGETKKSFLSNTGRTMQSTPVRQAFTPRVVNLGSMIYNDDGGDTDRCTYENVEFTRPIYKCDNFNKDMFDYLPVLEPKILKQFSPPGTPPPIITQPSMEFDCSYNDEFFTDDFSNETIPDVDLGLPALY